MPILRRFSGWPLSSTDSSILPTKHSRHRSRGLLTSRRYSRLAILATGFLVCFALYGFYAYVSDSDGGLPPLYEAYLQAERKLPQHSEDLPWPEGKHAKFIWFSNLPVAVGWGNVMQAMIVNFHLAYTLKRSYVFHNYTWNRYETYSDYNGNLIPSKVPVSAMLSGPIVGGSMGDSDVPRAVSADYFKIVCPEPKIIYTESIKSTLSDASGQEILDAWVSELGKMEDRCLQIEQEQPQIFDYLIFGSHKIVDMWPSLSQSPVLKQWAWSQLVLDAYEENEHFLKRRTVFNPLPDTSNSIVDGLMAVHIRHGDFANHCPFLANYSANYNGFNTFDSLPDRFTPPAGGGWGATTPENHQIYEDHCFPSISRVVQRIEEVKAERKGHGAPLKRLYILTNAKRPWLAQLKQALDDAAVGEWDMIASSRDLELNKEQRYTAQNVDMYIASRAQIFIGNGFSSLTSNVVVLRMSNGVEPLDTRMW